MFHPAGVHLSKAENIKTNKSRFSVSLFFANCTFEGFYYGLTKVVSVLLLFKLGKAPFCYS